jgi:hypothetical protein
MPELPELKAELLLKMAKEVKAGMMRRGLKGDLARNLLSEDVRVTADEIAALADALKSNAFYVPSFVYSEAMRIADAEA